MFGDGTQTRSFTYVADVVDALVKLAQEPRAIGEVFNIGNTEEVTIADLAERVKRMTDSASPVQFIPYDQAYEAGFEDMPRRVPDISKVRQPGGLRAAPEPRRNRLPGRRAFPEGLKAPGFRLPGFAEVHFPKTRTYGPASLEPGKPEKPGAGAGSPGSALRRKSQGPILEVVYSA